MHEKLITDNADFVFASRYEKIVIVMTIQLLLI